MLRYLGKKVKVTNACPIHDLFEGKVGILTDATPITNSYEVDFGGRTVYYFKEIELRPVKEDEDEKTSI